MVDFKSCSIMIPLHDQDQYANSALFNLINALCVSCLQLFSIVVFATITAEGSINPATSREIKCIFNNNDSACHYGLAIGVLAFLECVVMLIIDVNFPNISNANQRKIIVVGDLLFSGESPFFSLLSRGTLHPKQGIKSFVAPHAPTSCMTVCFDVFIVGQRCGRSCGSSVSVFWPTSGLIPFLILVDHLMLPGSW